MLKKYLLTVQPTNCVRTRYIVKATSSFDAIDRAWAQAERGLAAYDQDTYVAARPATAKDIKLYGEWLI